MAYERDKVKGAVRTDFILSAEIVAITLGIVADAPLLNQVLILAGIAILVTIGVYGLVGIIVKLDDMGFWLAERRAALARMAGKRAAGIGAVADEISDLRWYPAMFLVGGGSWYTASPLCITRLNAGQRRATRWLRPPCRLQSI
ncbi:DUF808 family protein [Apirhabdus apintestini]|nr:DUF808 family protein [Enterobacteriaceae bacterium CA-0114]